MTWNQVNCHWVVLGCPFQVFTFCNGIHHLMLDEFVLKPIVGGGFEPCDPQKHRRVEPVVKGGEYLDRILREQIAKEKL